MVAKLTRKEMGTIISFSADDSTANVYSSDPVWMRKIQKIKGSKKCSIGYEINVPKSWIKVSPPRRYSEETKKKMAARLREARQNKSFSSSTGK